MTKIQKEKPFVRKVQKGELRLIAAALARAFYDDPPTQWVFPDDKRRLMFLEKMFYFYIQKLWFRHGECLTTTECSGAAVWLPPGAWEISPVQQLMLLPGIALRAGFSFGRTLRAIETLESKHPKEHHFYLPLAGVSPEKQGQGIGTTLLTPFLERCDRDVIPAYLEASSPTNRRLYERHGFEVTEEFRLAEDAPPQWRMWREPNRTI